MKTVLILRHAKSSWKKPDLDDHDRPLNARGKRDAPRIGKLLRGQHLVPDYVVCSTAKRARKTTEAVTQACGYTGEIEHADGLYMGDPEDYVATLRALPDACERALVVGHNPSVQELLTQLTGAYEEMPTAALAEVKLPIEHWSSLGQDPQGALAHLWTPKSLP